MPRDRSHVPPLFSQPRHHTINSSRTSTSTTSFPNLSTPLEASTPTPLPHSTSHPLSSPPSPRLRFHVQTPAPSPPPARLSSHSASACACTNTCYSLCRMHAFQTSRAPAGLNLSAQQEEVGCLFGELARLLSFVHVLEAGMAGWLPNRQAGVCGGGLKEGRCNAVMQINHLAHSPEKAIRRRGITRSELKCQPSK
jgi:hypothetical protein